MGLLRNAARQTAFVHRVDRLLREKEERKLEQAR
jgi:hypothetical protein